MGFPNRAQHGFTIPGQQGDQVDDFRAVSPFFQCVCGSAGMLHSNGIGNDGHVCTFPLYPRFPQLVGNLVRELRHFAALLQQCLILKIDHRVIRADSGDQGHLGIVGIGGRDDL